MARFIKTTVFPGRIGPRLTRQEMRHLRFAYRLVLVLPWGGRANVALILRG